MPNPFSEYAIKKLNPFAVESRYFLPEIEFPDAKKVLELARTAIEWCKKSLEI